MLDDFEKNIYNKIMGDDNKKEYVCNNETSFLFKTSQDFKNHFYFENLTDDEFFDIAGTKNSFVEFYKRIIRTGVGTLILGGVMIGGNKNKLRNNARINLDNNVLQKFKQITNFAHSTKTKIFLKIKSPFGRYNNSNKDNFSLKLASNYGLDPENKQKLLIRISDNKCNEMINDLSQTVLLSNIAGFDGIMIDATFDNVIGELSSSEFNKRIFGYFSETNDLLKKALKHIQTKNNTIILKASVLSMLVKTKNHVELCKQISSFNYEKYFNEISNYIKLGVDGFEFVFGTNENKFLNAFNPFEDEFIFKDFVYEFRNYLNENNIKNKFGDEILILYHDNIINMSKANKMASENIVNLIDVTKNIYSDNNFLKNLFLKKSYINCIKCSECDKKAHFNNKIECVINPSLSEETELLLNGNKKLVAVIGSGISGLICALTLIKKGFIVHIYEQKNELNHFGKLTTIFGFDKELDLYYKQIEKQIEQQVKTGKLTIYLNQKFVASNETLNKYYSIIIATGFKTKFLAITGAVLSHVQSIYDVLNNKNALNNKKHIVIYAKSMLSIKLALYLIKSHKNITIIIKDIKYFINEKNANLLYFFWNLYQKQANILLFSKIIKINEDNIDVIMPRNLNINSMDSLLKILSNEKIKLINQQINLDCDLLIYEPDITPNNSLYAEIVSKNFPREVYLIGNALENSSLADIIKSGYFVGKNL